METPRSFFNVPVLVLMFAVLIGGGFIWVQYKHYQFMAVFPDAKQEVDGRLNEILQNTDEMTADLLWVKFNQCFYPSSGGSKPFKEFLHSGDVDRAIQQCADDIALKTMSTSDLVLLLDALSNVGLYVGRSS